MRPAVMTLTTAALLCLLPTRAWSARQRASLGASGAVACALDTGASRQSPVDACISCHARTQGSFATGHGHPVNVRYSDAQGLRDALRPDPQARSNLVLPSGVITCMTCHDPGSELPFRLAASIAGPVGERLCQQCHAMDLFEDTPTGERALALNVRR